MVYEYVLTMTDEAELVWQRKANSVSWIFLANRAYMVANLLFRIICAACSTLVSLRFSNYW